MSTPISGDSPPQLPGPGVGASGSAGIFPWPRRRIRLAALLLVAYGTAGLAIAAVSVVLLAEPAGQVGSALTRQADAGHWLDLADEALADAQASSSGAAASLEAARSSSESAAALFLELEDAMNELRQASSFSIFGIEPLAGIGMQAGEVADRSGALADDIAILGATLAAESGNLERLAGDAGRIRADLAGLRELLDEDASGRLTAAMRTAIILALLAALWLLLPAVASLLVGLYLLRELRGSTGSAGA